MLQALTIRNIVLVETLSLSFERGLGILTGETGGGKSILLDALNLALGGRADAGLVRQAADQGGATAEFMLANGHPAFSLIRDQGLGIDPEQGRLILRRTLSSDGRSRAFVNDQAVTVGFLKTLGETLVEVHGQHDDRGLLNPRGHRMLLDAFGGLETRVKALANLYTAWRDAEGRVQALKAELEKKHAGEEYDRHCFEELDTLAPKASEEVELAEKRALMMQGEKATRQLIEILNLLEEGDGVESKIRSALRRLERLPSELAGYLEPALEALESAAGGAQEGVAALHRTARELDYDQNQLETVEERLFALRALSRKHRCPVDDLPSLRTALEKKLAGLDAGDEALKELTAEAAGRCKKFEGAALALSNERKKAAKALDQGVAGELAPLKLEKARFRTAFEDIQKEKWGPEGAERVEFEVSTNPGAPFGGLLKIASGGELARFILALKVVLASAGSAPTLIFDEVDRGVGGAVADAVGERLARLAATVQVLVVTHSPQVAARATTHWRVGKEDTGGKTLTVVTPLDQGAKREEIARMLSGAKVTDKARAAASSLIAGAAQ
ncbi:MAG: DNA repair protein RecN [Proteobacteria bacterium]|nr:DNA repair protein RecN [Pseudomonadota bacterium]